MTTDTYDEYGIAIKKKPTEKTDEFGIPIKDPLKKKDTVLDTLLQVGSDVSKASKETGTLNGSGLPSKENNIPLEETEQPETFTESTLRRIGQPSGKFSLVPTEEQKRTYKDVEEAQIERTGKEIDNVKRNSYHGVVTPKELSDLYNNPRGKETALAIVDNIAPEFSPEKDGDNVDWNAVSKKVKTKFRENGVAAQFDYINDLDQEISDLTGTEIQSVSVSGGTGGAAANVSSFLLPEIDPKNSEQLSKTISQIESADVIIGKGGLKMNKEKLLNKLNEKLFYITADQPLAPEITALSPKIKEAITRVNIDRERGEKTPITEFAKNDKLNQAHFEAGLNFIKNSQPGTYTNVLRGIAERGKIADVDFENIASIGQDLVNQQIFIRSADNPELIDQETNLVYDSYQTKKADYAKILSEELKSMGKKNTLKINPKSIDEAVAKHPELTNKEIINDIKLDEANGGYGIVKGGGLNALFRGIAAPIKGINSTVNAIFDSPVDNYLNSKRLDYGDQNIADKKGQYSGELPSERNNIFNDILEGAGQFIPQVILARGIGKAIKAPINSAIGRVSPRAVLTTAQEANISAYPGTFISTFLQSAGDGYTDMLQKTGDVNTAKLVGAIDGTSAALFSMILPETQIAQKFRGILKGAKDDLAQNILKVIAKGEGKEAAKPFIKDFVTNVLNITGQEILEEDGTAIVDYMTEALFSPTTIKDRDLAKELWETTKQTALSMVIPAVLGGGGAANQNKPFTRQGLNSAAINFDEYKETLDKSLEDGKVSQTDYNDAVQVLSTHRQSIKASPQVDANGLQMPEKTRLDYAFQETLRKINQDKADKQTDEVQKKFYEKKAKEADKVKEEIFYGKEKKADKSLPQTEDQWKEKIAAATTEEEKEAIMQEHADWIVNQQKDAEKVPRGTDITAVIQKAVDGKVLKGSNLMMAETALKQEGGAEQFLQDVADQALNKIAPDATANEESMKRARETYGDELVNMAIEKFPVTQAPETGEPVVTPPVREKNAEQIKEGAEQTVGSQVRELNVIGKDIGLDKPRRQDFKEGVEGDKEYADANFEHNKKVDAVIGGLTKEGTLIDNQGNEYLVSVTSQGVRVVDKLADGSEGENYYYRKGKRISGDTPFTHGFTFKPKETGVESEKTIIDKDGNKFRVEVVKNEKGEVESIRAIDDSGEFTKNNVKGDKSVGNFILTKTEDGYYPQNLSVSPNLRRKGIATALFDYAEKKLGLKISESKDLSQEGADFMRSRQPKTPSNETIPQADTKQQQVNDLMDDVTAFNKLPKNAKSRSAELNELKVRADELGLRFDDTRGRLFNEKGKRVMKISADKPSSLSPDFNEADYSTETKQHIETLSKNTDALLGLPIIGNDGRQLSKSQMEGALKSVKDGKPSRSAKSLHDFIEDAVQSGGIELIDKITGKTVKVPVSEYFDTFKEPVKELTDAEIEQLNFELTDDSFNFNDEYYGQERLPQETEQPPGRSTIQSQEKTGSGKEGSGINTKEKVGETPISKTDTKDKQDNVPPKESNLTDSGKGVNLKQISKDANDIITGKKIFERFSPQEQHGLTEGGANHVEASLILSRGETTGGQDNTTPEAQENSIEQYAKDNSVWTDNTTETLTQKYGEPIAAGEEAIVWFDEKTGKVIKTQDTFQYDNLQQKLDGITLHNSYFPEAPLKVLGFGRNSKGEFQVIVEQPFVKGEKLTPEEIKNHLEKTGFQEDENDHFSNGDTIIEDVHTGNAIKTPEGNVVIIDPIMRLNTAEQGYGGTRKIKNETKNINATSEALEPIPAEEEVITETEPIEDSKGAGKEKIPPEEPPVTPKKETGEEFENKPKAILNRIYDSTKVSDTFKEKFRNDPKDLRYNPQSHETARQVASQIVDEFGEQDAVAMAESGRFDGDVNSLIFAEAIDRTFNNEQAANTQEEKIEFAEQWADFAIRYDETAREKGRFISAIYDFYKKSPLGVVLSERAKRDVAFKEWFQKREGAYKEVFEAIKDEPEFKDLVKEKVTEELKKERAEIRQKRRDKIISIFDKGKIKGDNLSSSIIPPQIWNAAVEVMKQTALAGESIITIIEKGVEYIKTNHKDAWDEEAFKNEWSEKLAGMDGKKVMTDEESLKKKQERVLERFRKRLTGLSDQQKEDVIRKSFAKLVENRALEYDEFKKIIADVMGLGELTAAEITKLTGFLNDINAVQDAADNVMAQTDEQKIKDAIKNFDVTAKKAESSGTKLSEILFNRVDLGQRTRSLIQLNTLGVFSLIKNVGYNVFNQIFVRIPKAIYGTAIDQAIYGLSFLSNKVFGSPIVKPDVNIFLAQKGFFNKGAEGGKQAVKQLFTGLTTKDYFQKEIHTSKIKPWTSLKDLWNWGRGKKHLSRVQIADKVLQGTVGVPAEIVARGLNIGDKPFRFAAEGAAATTIGRQQLGLKGVYLDRFIRFPKEVSKQIYKDKGLSEESAAKKSEAIEKRIISEGEQAVFQQENMINDVITGLKKALTPKEGSNPLAASSGEVVKMVGLLNLPYVKTPVNIMWEFFNLMNPELALLQSFVYGIKAARNGSREDFVKSKKWLAHAATGYSILAATAYIASIGALSGDDDDEAYKAKESKGKGTYEKAHSVNISKVQRAGLGESTDDEDGDLKIDLSWFGPLGSVMNFQANKYENMPKEERENMSYIDDLLSRMESGARDGLVNTTFRGAFDAVNALTSGRTDGMFLNMINVATNLVEPATIAQISRANRKYEYQVKGDTFSEKLQNNLNARFFGKVTPKVNIWGEKMEKGNPVLSMLGVNVHNTDVTAPQIHKDFKKTGNSDFYPSAISGTISVDGTPKKLNTEQQLQMETLVGKARASLVDPFANDAASLKGKRYSQLDDEEKVEALKKLYSQGYEVGKKEFIELYPEFMPSKKKQK